MRDDLFHHARERLRVKIATVNPAAAVLLGPEREARIDRHERTINDEFKPEVRENVHDCSRHGEPRRGDRSGAQSFPFRRWRVAPVRRGNLQHATEQSCFGALTQQDRAVFALDKERDAEA